MNPPQPHNAERQLRILEGNGDGIMNHLDAQFSAELSVSDELPLFVFGTRSLWLTIWAATGTLSSPVQNVPSDDQGGNGTSCF